MQTLNILSLLAASAASAAGTVQENAALDRVLECRRVTSEQERLACYDRAVGALATPSSPSADDGQAEQRRRAGFGLGAQASAARANEVKEPDAIEGRLRGVTQNNAGKWVLTLEDGARWVQIDSRELPVSPSAGHSIRIRRGAIGSYLANINGQVALRVRRID